MNRHRALDSCFAHDLFGKPLHTFPDHALVSGGEGPQKARPKF
jgi:hypothetical protein